MATRDSWLGAQGRMGLAAAGLLGVGLGSLLLCGCPGPSTAGSKSGGSDPLDAVRVAYQQATTYADAGELHIEFTKGGESREIPPIPFAVSLERPNKLRVNSFDASIACDGKQFYAIVADQAMSDQILYHPAPADLALSQIYSDPALDQMLSGGTGVRLPQLELLLGDKPLASMFGEQRETKRLEDRAIGDEEAQCQRVEVKSELGKFVAWIDPKAHVLRRLEMPTALFQKEKNPGDKVEYRVWAEFEGAKIGGKIDPVAFQFGELPASAMLLKRFVPPPPEVREEPPELLGKQLDKFEFVDLDGKKVDSQSLKGKVAVLDMWFLACPYCFAGFPNLQKVYEKYKDDDRVAFLTVDTDEPTIPNKSLQDAFKEKGLTLPIVRDPKHFAKSVFNLEACPTTIVLAPNGTVQEYKLGFERDLAETLPKKIDQVLAGTDLAQEALVNYDREREQFKQRKMEALEGTTQQFELPQGKIGEKTEPTAFRLTKLWATEGIKNPGNLIVIPAEAGPRIIVLDGWNKVVELDTAGKVAAEHTIELPKGATITQLRTAVDGQEHRYFAAFNIREQQVFLFDSEWKQLLRYPEGTHAGIFDVQLGDLDGDGQLELNIGYAGAVGVQNVSFEGKRLWANRDQDNVISLAVLDPDAAGHRPLWCANERPAIAVLNYDGKSLPDIQVPDRPVDVLVTAHLDNPEQLDVATLVSPKLAELLAVGIDREGHELWSYPLPAGLRTTPCNVLVAGRVRTEGAGQWLLTGPDGSVHVLAADGTLIDKFNYGVDVTGLGTAEIDGRPVLLLSSAHEVTAWSVEPGEPAVAISATDH